jgi:hypothetical protein
MSALAVFAYAILPFRRILSYAFGKILAPLFTRLNVFIQAYKAGRMLSIKKREVKKWMSDI